MKHRTTLNKCRQDKTRYTTLSTQRYFKCITSKLVIQHYRHKDTLNALLQNSTTHYNKTVNTKNTFNTCIQHSAHHTELQNENTLNVFRQHTNQYTCTK
jgi:hypothetical protein